MSDALKAERLLLGGCWHEILPQEKDESGMCGIAKCAHCGGIGFVWYCPDSPDHLCHYHSSYADEEQRRYVISINGERIWLPEGHDPQYETSDDCIFCHLPEERK